MKGLNKLALCTAIAASSMSVNAELTALNDSALGELTGQAGVSLDVNLALSIEEFRYIDTDGFTDVSATTGAPIGVTGGRGSVSFTGIAIGQIDDFSAQGRAALDADLATEASVLIEGITIDVSDAGGVRIGLGNIGSAANGLDIRSDISINQDLGATTGNVGEFYISNLTNQISADLVTELTNATGVTLEQTQVAPLLSQSPYIPVFVEIQGGGADGDQGLTINAEVGLIIDEIAYVDDGNAIGVRNLIVGDITWAADNNQIIGLGGLKVEGLTVDVIDDNGTTKLALGNINVKGDIFLGDIFLSSRDATTGLSSATDAATGLTNSGNSLGSVLIRDLDTTGTSVLVYAHD